MVGDCKYEYAEAPALVNLHVKARETLDDRFKPQLGGCLPRCIGHDDVGTLMWAKTADKSFSAIVGHLFFTCCNPVKEGGYCLKNGGRWNAVADMPDATADERLQMENMFAMNMLLKKQRQEEGQNTMANLFFNSTKNDAKKTGVFAS